MFRTGKPSGAGGRGVRRQREQKLNARLGRARRRRAPKDQRTKILNLGHKHGRLYGLEVMGFLLRELKKNAHRGFH